MTENDSQKVEVTIKKEGNSGNENENVEQLKDALEKETIIREDLESKLKLIAEQKINEKIKEYGIPESEADYFRQNPEALKGFKLGKSSQREGSGKGTIPMTPEMLAKERNSENDKKEFDSIEEMLEWARVNDKTAYEIIKQKSAQGLIENKSYFEWKDSFDKDGRSIIGRTIQRANAQARAKLGHKE